jgi:hypothetical protein
MNGKFVAHESIPESGAGVARSWSVATLPGRPRSDAYSLKADVNQPRIDEAVENDPYETSHRPKNKPAMTLSIVTHSSVAKPVEKIP